MRRGCQWRCAQAREPQQRERRAGDAGNLVSGKSSGGESSEETCVLHVEKKGVENPSAQESSIPIPTFRCQMWENHNNITNIDDQ